MSEAADVRARILKLPRLRSRDPEDLRADAPPADLRRPREQVTEVPFDADGHAFGRPRACTSSSGSAPRGKPSAPSDHPPRAVLTARSG
jgi:hypothetical protein